MHTKTIKNSSKMESKLKKLRKEKESLELKLIQNIEKTRKITGDLLMKEKDIFISDCVEWKSVFGIKKGEVESIYYNGSDDAICFNILEFNKNGKLSKSAEPVFNKVTKIKN